MKLNSKPTTDIEQSKRLLTLGIKKETGECNCIVGINYGIFLTKEDAIDYINTIQNNFEHSKKLINEY